MGAFNVMPNDQHLKTAEGVHLNNNDATLADLAILPDTLILAKVSRKFILLTEIILHVYIVLSYYSKQGFLIFWS